MNERNVEALAELPHAIIPNEGRMPGVLIPPPKGEAKDCAFCQGAAQKLAGRGVLVPSALTLGEIRRTCEDVVFEKEVPEFVDQLARIAAGRPQYDFQEPASSPPPQPEPEP